MKKKRMLALLLTVAMAGTMLAGCGSSDGKEDEKGKNQAKSEGKVYYLNFKPEQADDWVKLAETYTDETGVQVDVQTAASGTYESQLNLRWQKKRRRPCFRSTVLSVWHPGKITVMTCQTVRFTRIFPVTIMC